MRTAHTIDYYQPQLGYRETYLAHVHANMGSTIGCNAGLKFLRAGSLGHLT